MDAVGEEVEAATYKHCQLYIRDAYTAISAACVADHDSTSRRQRPAGRRPSEMCLLAGWLAEWRRRTGEQAMLHCLLNAAVCMGGIRHGAGDAHRGDAGAATRVRRSR